VVLAAQKRIAAQTRNGRGNAPHVNLGGFDPGLGIVDTDYDSLTVRSMPGINGKYAGGVPVNQDAPCHGTNGGNALGN